MDIMKSIRGWRRGDCLHVANASLLFIGVGWSHENMWLLSAYLKMIQGTIASQNA